MFAIHGTSGQMYRGPLEDLRKVVPAWRTLRVQAVDPELSRIQPSPDWMWEERLGAATGQPVPAPPPSPKTPALQAYVATQQGGGGRMPLTRVSDVMTHTPFLLQQDTSLWDALQQLAGAKLSQAPVVNRAGQLVGLLTWVEFMRPDRLPDPQTQFVVWRQRMAQPVSEWMVSPVPSVAPDTDLRQLAQALLETGLPGLPVVATDGGISGYVSRGDILRAVAHDPPLDLWAR